ncbi:MAG: 2Fe-2S iron-sulfur cluster-binding protein [Paracoccaceae bacterium]
MFHDLILSDVQAETADSVVLSFNVPEALSDAFSFVPGQYLTLRAEVNGEDVRRNYSIASLPGETLCVGVKQVEDGAFSTFAQGLVPGGVLSVMPPEGRFVCKDEQDIVLIAAGSGITPMVAIAGDALARGARVTLVYGNRQTDTIMFRDVLDALKDRYLDRFTLIHVLSREPQDVALLNGRIDGDKVTALAQAGAIDLAGADGVFLCGPGAMIDNVTAALDAYGVPSDKVHFERFTIDGEAPRAPKSDAAEAAAAKGVAVAVYLDGTRRDFRFESQDDTVIDAAARAGLELPFSCKGGMCCTCRCKVAEGSAEMAVNYSLEPWELEAGFTLACQARPTSDNLVLDFDAA